MRDAGAAGGRTAGEGLGELGAGVAHVVPDDELEVGEPKLIDGGGAERGDERCGECVTDEAADVVVLDDLGQVTAKLRFDSRNRSMHRRKCSRSAAGARPAAPAFAPEYCPGGMRWTRVQGAI